MRTPAKKPMPNGSIPIIRVPICIAIGPNSSVRPFKVVRFRPKKPRKVAIKIITVAMMAILRNLRRRKPTIKPAINGKSITTNVGKPKTNPEVMNSKILSNTPILRFSH